MKTHINFKLDFRLLAILVLLFSIPAQAQKKLQKKVAGLTNLEAIMKKVDRFYEKEEREKERGKSRNLRTSENSKIGIEAEEEFESELNHWKRWEYFNQTRLKPNGDLEDVAAKTVAAWEKTNTKYGPLGSGTNAQWAFVGPWNSYYQGGFYRGLSKGDRIVFHPTDPNTFYVCCLNGGVWKTTNGGAGWVCITYTLPLQTVSGMAINPNNTNHIYVITGDNKGGNGIAQNSCGIWVTYDGGFNWLKTSFNSDRKTSIYNGYKIVMQPGTPSTLFAATASGLYRSTDSGATWGTPIIGGSIFDIEFDPSDATHVYASGASTFYRSIDSGASFPSTERTTFSGANRIEIGVSPNNSSYVYLLCGPFGGGGAVGTNTFRGLYRSTSNGSQNSFSLRANTPNVLCNASNGIINSTNDNDQSRYDLAIDVDKTNAETVVVAGKIVWKSTNGGTTLTNLTPYNEGNENAIPPSNYIHPDIQDLGYNPLNNNLYACTDGGVYRSTNGGTVWTDITNGIHATTFFHMANAAFDANKIMAGCQDNGVKYKKDLNDFYHVTGADGFDCSFGPSAASSVYATINASFGRFSSSGASQNATTPANTSFFPVVAADPVTNNVVYLATGGGGIQKSTDAGVSWNMVSNVTTQQSINISPANASRVYVAGVSSIYRTDNGGSTWSTNLASSPGFPGSSTITDIFSCPGNSDYVYVTTGGYTASQKVYYSGDAGATWSNISGTLPEEVKVNCVVVDLGNNAYIGTDAGVYYQAVYSSDWTPFYNGLPRCPITDLAIHQGSSKVRASLYGHGVWEASLFTTCDANYTLSGYVEGQRFYQVSNILTADAGIVGGNATKIVTQAGTKIVLTNGFRAYENNYFKASIKPCEAAGIVPVPLGMESNSRGIPPLFINEVDKGDTTTLYRFGTIATDYSSKNKVLTTIRAEKEGDFRLIISNKEKVEVKSPETFFVAKNAVVSKEIAGLPKGKYYAILYYGDSIAHFQELFIE